MIDLRFCKDPTRMRHSRMKLPLGDVTISISSSMAKKYTLHIHLLHEKTRLMRHKGPILKLVALRESRVSANNKNYVCSKVI